jgi:hypothetical protein
VLLAHDVGVEDARRRGERIDRRIEAELGDPALEADRRVEVRERRRGGGVRVVVGGHEDGLQARDRPLARRRDALLQVGHLRRQVGLVTHRRRHPPKKRRDLGASLREAEDVVDEEEEVAALLVAEVLRHGERAEADAEARPRRLVHLAEHERRLVDDARFVHLADEVVALARALAHPGEDRVAAVLLGDVADELLDDHRLAHAGAAEDADLAALGEWRDEIDDLHARLEDLGLGGLVVEARGLAMDRVARVRVDRALPIDRVAEDVENAPERGRPDRDADRAARRACLGAARDAVGRRHRHRAHPVVAEVLLHFGDERPAVRTHHLDRVEDARKLAGRELDVEDRAGDLDDVPDRLALLRGRLGGGSGGDSHGWGNLLQTSWGRDQDAWAPVAISIISRVMLAWRTLL